MKTIQWRNTSEQRKAKVKGSLCLICNVSKHCRSHCPTECKVNLTQSFVQKQRSFLLWSHIKTKRDHFIKIILKFLPKSDFQFTVMESSIDILRNIFILNQIQNLALPIFLSRNKRYLYVIKYFFYASYKCSFVQIYIKNLLGKKENGSKQDFPG